VGPALFLQRALKRGIAYGDLGPEEVALPLPQEEPAEIGIDARRDPARPGESAR
jgi:hypothetical protein